MKKAPYRLYLSEEEIPKQWYNLRADMKELPDPMINPATMKPAVEEDLYPVFCKELAHQEMDNETRYVDIPDEVREMYKIAIPSMLMNSIMSIMTVFMNMILSGFSALSVSVYSIYFKLQQFLYMAVSGMSNAVIAIISYNYGARNKERIKSCIRISLISTIMIMISGTVIFQLFPVQLLSLFNASDEMLSIGIPALKTISLSFVFGGVNVQGCAILQSLDSSKESLVVTLLRQFIIILPLAFALSKMFGLNYVWFAFPVSELVALILCIRFLKEVDEDFIENLN